MKLAVIVAIFSLGLAAQEPAPDAPPSIDQLIKTGRAAYAKGEYAAARTALEQAWNALQESPQSEPKRYDVVKQLEAVLSAAGEYKDAQDYEELAINWRENNVGLKDPKLADEWIELSNLCQRLKDFSRGNLLLQRALSLHMQTYGADSIAVADDWSRIALLFAAEKKLDQTIGPLQMAIRIRETVLGAEHPAILTELDRLASAQITLRRYAEAENTFRRSMVIRERLTGPMSADLIATVEGLAYAQFGQKEYEDAEKGYKRLIALWIFSTGQTDHPMIALSYDKLATFYRAQERWEEGAEAAGKAVALRGVFLASALQHEAAEQMLRKNTVETVRLLQRAIGVLDESRPEHADLLKQLQDAMKELVPEAKPARRPPSVATKSTAKSTGKKW